MKSNYDVHKHVKQYCQMMHCNYIAFDNLTHPLLSTYYSIIEYIYSAYRVNPSFPSCILHPANLSKAFLIDEPRNVNFFQNAFENIRMILVVNF